MTMHFKFVPERSVAELKGYNNLIFVALRQARGLFSFFIFLMVILGIGSLSPPAEAHPLDVAYADFGTSISSEG